MPRSACCTITSGWSVAREIEPERACAECLAVLAETNEDLELSSEMHELLVDALDVGPAREVAERVRRVLAQLPDECPGLRAQLSVRLGDALMVDEDSDRATNVADAIEAYRDGSVLPVKALNPRWWASARARLAAAYMERQDDVSEAARKPRAHATTRSRSSRATSRRTSGGS